MRGPAVLVGAAGLLSVAVLAGSTGTASAEGGLTLPTGLPTITLPPVPLPTISLPSVPTPSVSVPPPPTATPGGGGGPTPGGGAGGASASTPTAAPQVGGAPGADATVPGRTGSGQTGKHRTARHHSNVKPMISGRPEAKDVLDDETTPALYRASKAFLEVDDKIAALTRARAAMNAARNSAADAASAYTALQTDATAARTQALGLHARNERLHRMLVIEAVRSYQTGRATSDDRSTRDLVAAATRADRAATQAEMRVGALVADQARAKEDYQHFAAAFGRAQRDLTGIDQRLNALAHQRSLALAAAQSARAGDLAQHRQTLVESGRLGAQIRAASAQLASAGRTVQGTGELMRPSSGVITSPFGLRMHPILHYVKLHTGTDFAVGDGFARAADDGRVLFTVVSRAYGNFTVIDHGTIDGRHLTTAYAHQARFLVRPGDVVRKGQRIGLIGATGYATGPHLHFEVRDDGAVVDPMRWLAAG